MLKLFTVSTKCGIVQVKIKSNVLITYDWNGFFREKDCWGAKPEATECRNQMRKCFILCCEQWSPNSASVYIERRGQQKQLKMRRFLSRAAPSYQTSAAIWRLQLQDTREGELFTLAVNYPVWWHCGGQIQHLPVIVILLSLPVLLPLPSCLSCSAAASLRWGRRGGRPWIWCGPEAEERSEFLPAPRESTDLCSYFPRLLCVSSFSRCLLLLQFFFIILLFSPTPTTTTFPRLIFCCSIWAHVHRRCVPLHDTPESFHLAEQLVSRR